MLIMMNILKKHSKQVLFYVLYMFYDVTICAGSAGTTDTCIMPIISKYRPKLTCSYPKQHALTE